MVFESSIIVINNINSRQCYCRAKTNTENFLWRNKRATIKHDTLCNDYNDGCLKNVDIGKKTVALKYSSI